MAFERNPNAELAPQATDIEVTDDQVLQLSLLAPLRSELKTFLRKNPGSYALRQYQYQPGQAPVFVQGEPGWTAFYVLTTEDILLLKKGQLASVTDAATQQRLRGEITVLEARLLRLGALEANHGERTVAVAKVAVAKKNRSPRNLLARWTGAAGRPALGQRIVDQTGSSVYIPWDATRSMLFENLTAPLREGEIFGEVSCLYRTPRPATVVLQRDCVMLEMLRNVLDKIQRNKVFKARIDEIYRTRTLELEVRHLSLFSELSDEEYATVFDSIELVSVEPGTIIFDEHERSDGLYIVRMGLVKVMKNTSALLAPADIVGGDWKKLCQVMMVTTPLKADDRIGAALAAIWRKLPDGARNLMRQVANGGAHNEPERMVLLGSLNELIMNPRLADLAELQACLPTLLPLLPNEARAALERRAALLKKKSDWEDAEARRTNRRLLEALYPTVVRKLGKSGGPEIILSYASQGDVLGESGLLSDPPRPRNTTCIAHSHPNHYGQTELVRIPAGVLFKLKGSSPGFASRMRAEAATHRAEAMLRLLTPVWEDTVDTQLTESVERLGLIQGQQLMLIDLDRCTRCDECVRACVATHGDDHSRLFLDGPRFSHYLVPTTCRSCLDPVCLIGCPVGSIHRGHGREIVIEDWCIGCGLCADNCPYGSIQMHDEGILQERSRGWRYLPATVAAQGWEKTGYKDAHWLIGSAPFLLDRDLRDELTTRLPKNADVRALDALCFRRDFKLSRQSLQGAEFRLELVSLAEEVKVWINGVALEPDEKPRRGRHFFTLPSWQTAPDNQLLRAGSNVLAVRTKATRSPLEILLQARLDQIRRPHVPEGTIAPMGEEVTEKLVTFRAVVCDLCSKLPGQQPACVQACPHEAALRVDARKNFPQN